MAITIFAGPDSRGGLRTVACPTWDGAACHCQKQPDGSVPAHLEHRWPAGQDAATSVREARLLAAQHYRQTETAPRGDIDGLQMAAAV